MKIHKLLEKKIELQEEIKEIDSQIREEKRNNLRKYFETNKYFKIDEAKNNISVYYLCNDIDSYRICVYETHHIIIGDMLVLNISKEYISLEIEEEAEIGFGTTYADNEVITKEEFLTLIDQNIDKLYNYKK